jgi:hypothetical protein
MLQLRSEASRRCKLSSPGADISRAGACPARFPICLAPSADKRVRLLHHRLACLSNAVFLLSFSSGAQLAYSLAQQIVFCTLTSPSSSSPRRPPAARRPGACPAIDFAPFARPAHAVTPPRPCLERDPLRGASLIERDFHALLHLPSPFAHRRDPRPARRDLF